MNISPSLKIHLRDYLLLYLLIIIQFVLVFNNPGTVSYTFDEKEDAAILECIKTKGTFNCLNDITQTRFPYYIHGFVNSIWDHPYANYFVSFLFSLFNLLIIWKFAKKEYNLSTANIAAVLMLTSIPLLASSRMLLTHSNVIFTTFNILAVITFYYFLKNKRFKFLILCAAFLGFSAGSSVLAVFTPLFFLIFYVLHPVKIHWKYLLVIPVFLFVFFGSTLIYIQPAIFKLFLLIIKYGHSYPYWNHLSTGSAVSPPYFSFLLFAIKTGPFVIILLFIAIAAVFKKRSKSIEQFFLFSVLLFSFIYLLLKSAYFKYDAPHHHIQLYPFIYLFIAYGISKIYTQLAKYQLAIYLSLSIGFLWQIVEIKKFYPNLLFYGSQYGDKYLGEFYGPAVMHGQDTDAFINQVDKIIKKEPHVRFLLQENNGFDLYGDHYIKFNSSIKDISGFDYAIMDRCFSQHFNFPDKVAYNELIEKNCEEYFVYYFPEKTWMYKIYKCK
ncbi:MAG: glycosyltransferase family 39 protein [Bacteroidota bacterium]|nr:glycosyltransferase family 39 protein [Bacteroidota bacterium]